MVSDLIRLEIRTVVISVMVKILIDSKEAVLQEDHLEVVRA
jgi:hypothetical protein